MPDAAFDVIALLSAGHRDVEAMFARIERPDTGSEKEILARDIARTLLVQSQLLEEIVFPAFRAAGVHPSLLDQADASHYAIEELIGDLQDASRKDDTFDARLRSLASWVKRVIKRTESEIFPEAQSSGADLVAIGLLLAARKAELTSGLEEPLSLQSGDEDVNGPVALPPNVTDPLLASGVDVAASSPAQVRTPPINTRI